MPFQQSTAPRHRHRCTMQENRVDTVCAAYSVPATDLTVDWVLLASHGPMCTYRHITHSKLSSFIQNIQQTKIY